MTVAMTMRDWDELIRDVVGGRWKDPETGQTARVPFETIHLDDTLDGQEAELIRPLNLGKRLAVVSDANTVEAMGRRVAKALRTIATVDEIPGVFGQGRTLHAAVQSLAGAVQLAIETNRSSRKATAKKPSRRQKRVTQHR